MVHSWLWFLCLRYQIGCLNLTNGHLPFVRLSTEATLLLELIFKSWWRQQNGMFVSLHTISSSRIDLGSTSMTGNTLLLMKGIKWRMQRVNSLVSLANNTIAITDFYLLELLCKIIWVNFGLSLISYSQKYLIAVMILKSGSPLQYLKKLELEKSNLQSVWLSKNNSWLLIGCIRS